MIKTDTRCFEEYDKILRLVGWSKYCSLDICKIQGLRPMKTKSGRMCTRGLGGRDVQKV